MSPFRFGVLLGLAVGAANILHTMLWPLAEDTAAAVLTFYAPVFFLWALSGFLAARSTGRWLSGVRAAIIVALVTALIYDALVLLRVNLFLEELTQRTDWQRLMREYEASASSGLRTFINFAYLKDMPLKVAVETGFGVVMGTIGATLGVLETIFPLRSARLGQRDRQVDAEGILHKSTRRSGQSEEERQEATKRMENTLRR